MRAKIPLRRWPLAVVLAAGLAAVPNVSAASPAPPIPGLPSVPGLPGPATSSPTSQPGTPGLTDKGGLLDREKLPGSVVQDPGGTVAGQFPNGLPVPQLDSGTQASPISVKEARTRLFGKGYDTPGVVRARLGGNTTWLVSYGGTFALHDANLEDNLADTGSKKNNNGYESMADVLAAKPDVIFLDHSHFDHTHNLAEIAAKTGAPVVTSLGSCGWVKFEALKMGYKPADIKCNLLREPDGTPMNDADSYFAQPYGGEGVLFSAYGAKGKPERPLPGGLDDQAVLVKHTQTFNKPPMYPDEISPGAQIHPGENLDHIAKNPPDPAMLWRQYAPFDLEGGNYLHKVTYNGFTIAHHGSTGPTNALDPGSKDILSSLKSLGDNGRVDVEIGGIVEASWLNTNYFKDAKEYSKAIDAKWYFPVHHFDWYSYWLTSPAVSYWPGMQKTWADGAAETKGNFPQLCFLTDGEHAPNNYATLWQFNTADWQGDHVGKAIPLTGPGCYTG
ncbi:MAG TPA: hypothetical protein VG674_28220 [Amycolatopsis sp.]|nr:hypothetical protein [Amycolatopsis sp.]